MSRLDPAAVALAYRAQAGRRQEIAALDDPTVDDAAWDQISATTDAAIAAFSAYAGAPYLQWSEPMNWAWHMGRRLAGDPCCLYGVPMAVCRCPGCTEALD